LPATPDSTLETIADGRQRAVIEHVAPQVDGGRFPVKREVGSVLKVEADAFVDGHDVVRVVLRHRPPGDNGSPAEWREIPMAWPDNDRWYADLPLEVVGRHAYAVAAWADRFATWRRDLGKRLAAGQDVAVELEVGAALVAEAAGRARGADATRLRALAGALSGKAPIATRSKIAMSDELAGLMDRHADRRHETLSDTYEVVVDPVHARFSSWYELFPRSTAARRGAHGTLRDVIARLPYVADLGFDVLYLPPIHPIGTTHRKGPNNATTARPGDPGVPWAIGAGSGGHTAVHPDLGTVEDVRALASAADGLGIRLALDIAFQASPDHPWARAHPEWFRRLPDGTIRYAENPPKRYEDIYPFDFESEDWTGLWQALDEVVRFWIEQGVRIFRVDNPHTKPFRFWEWLIGGIKADHPDVLFLAEAFTRPKVMYHLAKAGFSQSYTYFTWRNTPQELAEYLTEVSKPPVSDFFRPNLWPNTPDILHDYLQHGGRPAFAARLVLAATLAASYGIYGPVFELAIGTAREPGSEEYLDSEKYQVRHWNLADPDSLAPLVRRVNAVRRGHPALQSNLGLRFHVVEGDWLLAYSKRGPGDDLVLVVVNLDPHHAQAGMLELPLAELGIDPEAPFEVTDLLTGETYLWRGSRNWVELDPAVRVAHVFEVQRRVRTESQFETYA
jgi:starch synthase (maltosyl-transferring)